MVAGVGDRMEPALDAGERAGDHRQAVVETVKSTPRTCRPLARRAAGTGRRWSLARTLTQKCPARSIIGQVEEPLSGRKPTSGGSSETEEKVPTIRPTGSPSGVDRGDRATPVG